MGIASRHGKLHVSAEDDGSRFRRMEDLLTADVFGAYRYLPMEVGILPVFAAAEAVGGQTLRQWTEARGIAWGELVSVQFAYWPSLAGKEPDLVVALLAADGSARLVTLVEVKLHSDQHAIGGKSQLGFYGAALADGLFDDELFDFELPFHRAVVFVTKEREFPRDALSRARSEVGDAHLEGRTDVFWIGWSTIAALARCALDTRRAEGAKAHELALLDDLVADLAERGFRPPRPMASLPLPRLEPLALPGLPRFVMAARRHPVASQLADLSALALDDVGATLSHWRLR